MVLTALLAALTLSQVDAKPYPSAALLGDQLVVADGNGSLKAWKKDLSFDAELSKKLNAQPLVAVARDGDTVWGFDGKATFTWSLEHSDWNEVKARAPAAPCLAFAVVESKPVCVQARGIHRFSDGKFWEAPKYDHQIKGQGFGMPKAVVVHGSQVAIGNGFGEWGGFLWLLDLKTDQWSKFYDELGNANGIAWTPDGWAVAWAMSHMMATAQPRLHDVDGKPRKESARLHDKYLRAVAWDGKALYGLEQDEIVKFKPDLTFTKVQKVKIAYGPEANAVGVSSGIAVMQALDGGRFLIVPTSGAPVVADGSKVTVLK